MPVSDAGTGAGGAPVATPLSRAIPCVAGLLLEDPHDVALLHDQQLLPVDLHLGARPLAEQHLVLGLKIDRNNLAALIAGPWADGDHLALLRLLGSGIRNDDPAGRLGFAVDAAHDNAVVQRTKLHRKTLSVSVGYRTLRGHTWGPLEPVST